VSVLGHGWYHKIPSPPVTADAFVLTVTTTTSHFNPLDEDVLLPLIVAVQLLSLVTLT